MEVLIYNAPGAFIVSNKALSAISDMIFREQIYSSIHKLSILKMFKTPYMKMIAAVSGIFTII